MTCLCYARVAPAFYRLTMRARENSQFPGQFSGRSEQQID